MPVTPQQIMDVADDMIGEECGEPELRAAASRSYYSLYHHALAFADNDAEVPISSLSGPSHKKLSQYYSSSVTHPASRRRAMRRAGILLRKCHDVRCVADYDLDSDFGVPAFQMMRHDCSKAIQAIESL